MSDTGTLWNRFSKVTHNFSNDLPELDLFVGGKGKVWLYFNETTHVVFFFLGTPTVKEERVSPTLSRKRKRNEETSLNLQSEHFQKLDRESDNGVFVVVVEMGHVPTKRCIRVRLCPGRGESSPSRLFVDSPRPFLSSRNKYCSQ